jgi:hypothetical protein
MPGLFPGIHAFLAHTKSWMAGTRPAMTGKQMHLIQILLPVYDNEGQHFGEELYAAVRDALSARFGGLTAFTRAPAQGLWTSEGETTHDDIVVFEVMAKEVDATWWSNYRKELERAFRQDTIVIRAQDIQVL